MVVMGGIVGSGIFVTPAIVASWTSTREEMIGAWIAGGGAALLGAFIYAGLSRRRPFAGGQYAYLREAYHPAVGFLYGWALLLVVQTGGMAAGAVTFARYFLELTHFPVPDWLIAALTLAALTIINCLGVKAGSSVQNVLTVIKILAIVMLVACALGFVGTPNLRFTPALDGPALFGLITVFAAAMGPVMFSYGGCDTASFVAAEMRRPERDLSWGLLIGMIGVVIIELSANVIYLGGLGANGLAPKTNP